MDLTRQKARIVNLWIYVPGLLLGVVGYQWAKQFSEFWFGFCQGFSAVFILAGLIYTAWCMLHFKNILFRI